MPTCDSRYYSAELNDLVKFSETINLSEEQRLQLSAIVRRLDNTFKSRFLSLRFFKKSFEELNHLVKRLLFDLEATKLERDRYMYALEKSNKSDHSN